LVNKTVGRKLLSERDENVLSSYNIGVAVSSASEGNYSLKEMRTFPEETPRLLIIEQVGRKLLSERDENWCLR